jgi:uncharacterized membrane protein
MPDPTAIVEEVAKESAKGIIEKLGDARAINSLISLIVVGVVLLIFWRNSEVNNRAVEASMTAIQSNAESNRKTAEALVKVSESVESINSNLSTSTSHMRTVVEKLQNTEDSQEITLKKISSLLESGKGG